MGEKAECQRSSLAKGPFLSGEARMLPGQLKSTENLYSAHEKDKQ